ncbi:endothelial cell-specific molecule 1 [Macrotis lagotis]|uniref:endothelial cell-specific molecule 1 n=1 Tax=Macrotis lagotis TaxID=92651 RepID=UPI003D699519
MKIAEADVLELWRRIGRGWQGDSSAGLRKLVTAKRAGSPAYKALRSWPGLSRSWGCLTAASRSPERGALAQPRPAASSARRPRGSAMKGLWLLLTALLAAPLAPAHPGANRAGQRYAVDCPPACDPGHCRSGQPCKQTVLDDCGCCRVCAANLGETCYRTVSGMDGAKCGPGLLCYFTDQEDAFGEEYGVCKECPYGTYGVGCKEICTCQYGICDKVTGKCLKFHFFQPLMPSGTRLVSSSDNELASGDGNAVSAAHPPVTKWLKPR